MYYLGTLLGQGCEPGLSFVSLIGVMSRLRGKPHGVLGEEIVRLIQPNTARNAAWSGLLVDGNRIIRSLRRLEF